MDNLVINNELTAAIINHKSANASFAISEGITDSGPQTALVNDPDALLDVAGRRHTNNASIVTQIQNAVLLVHWA
jgi:hypothetical protein